jgi:hypothetical protein
LRFPARTWWTVEPFDEENAMATNEAQMSEASRKALARHLRKSFEGKVLPHVLDNVSDDDLIEKYFAEGESKARAIGEKTQRLRDRLKKDSKVEVL